MGADLDEPGGAEEKEWLREPECDRKWLFKPVTIKAGLRHGEDWAEKLASHLGQALTIPCAVVELAKRNGREGIISLNLRPDFYQLQSGSLMLLSHPIAGYQPGMVKGRPGHSLINIKTVLDDLGAPPNCVIPPEFTAFDVFCGYIFFDAWIANRDRHDENWAALIPATGEAPARLCGSYDQANSLGYNVQEAERSRRLANLDGGVRRWAERATAHRLEYDPTGKPTKTLVQAAAEALDLAGKPARQYWVGQLEALNADIWDNLPYRLPKLSDPTRMFVSSLLEINRERLLDECT